MTYKKLYEIAEWKLDHGELTLGEFDEMTKPLDEELNIWIPCSERLPEDPDTKRIYASKTYQVTTNDGRTIVLLWRKTESRGKMVMRWEWHDGRIYHGDVLAWKPLSEPYKEEGDEK